MRIKRKMILKYYPATNTYVIKKVVNSTFVKVDQELTTGEIDRLIQRGWTVEIVRFQ